MLSYLKILYQKTRGIIYIILYDFHKITKKVDSKRILFLSDSRNEVSGNFLFIYNELKNEDYNVKFFLKANLDSVKKISDKYYLTYLIATSKYIFLDDYYPIIYPLKLRKGTEVIQLWHAMGAFKKVGYSRTSSTINSLTHRGYSSAIVSSEQIRKNYAEAFNMDLDKVLALGVPRTDIFFDDKYMEKIIKQKHQIYPQIKNKKVILFAPTFRGKGQKEGYYDFSWIDFVRFKNELKETYICLIKLHPFIKNKPDYSFEEDDFYIDLSSEREINDFLFITDILITDYSSVIFEYSFLKKPVVFFVPDLEEYKNERDFYYPIKKYIYGEIACNSEDLITKIKKPELKHEKLEEFQNFFCSACDGKSTKRIVNYFIRK